jgi:hypothetical protein
VAHERPARRVSQTVVPGETLRVELAGGVVQPAQQPGDGRQRSVGLAPVRIGRHGDLAIDEHEALASVLVDADWYRGTLESGVFHRPKEGMNRTRVRTRGAKHMRTDADDLARVRDPAIELLLRHTATLTNEWVPPPAGTPTSRTVRISVRSDKRSQFPSHPPPPGGPRMCTIPQLLTPVVVDSAAPNR